MCVGGAEFIHTGTKQFGRRGPAGREDLEEIGPERIDGVSRVDRIFITLEDQLVNRIVAAWHSGRVCQVLSELATKRLLLEDIDRRTAAAQRPLENPRILAGLGTQPIQL